MLSSGTCTGAMGLRLRWLLLVAALFLALVPGRSACKKDYSDAPVYKTADDTIEQNSSEHIQIQEFYGGVVENFKIHGRYVYVAQGRQLRVLDLSDLDAPQSVFTKVFHESINSLAIAGDALYLGMQGGPNILDISDPTHPRLHASFEIRARSMMAGVMGSRLCIWSEWSDIHPLSYDIRNPLQPFFETSAFYRFLYAIDEDSVFNFVQTSDAPLTCVIRRMDHTATQTLQTEHVIDSPNEPRFELADGHFVLAADSMTTMILARLDEARTLDVRGLSRSEFEQSHAHITSNGKWVTVLDEVGLKVFPVHDLDHAQLELKAPTRGPALFSGFSGDVLYVVHEGRVRILDLHDANEIREAGDFPEMQNVTHMDIQGDVAGVFTPGLGITFFQMDDPLRPIRRGLFPAPLTDAQSIALRGDVACVADETGLITLDLTQPDQPKPLGRVALDGQATHVKIMGDMAVVLTSKPRCYFIDVAQPSAPSIAGQVALTGYPTDLALTSNDLALISNDEGGMFCIDISDPGKPILKDMYAPTVSCQSVITSGTLAFLAAASLQEIDFARPDHPVFLGEVLGSNDGVRIVALARFQSQIFAYDTSGNSHVFDIAEPSRPKFLNTFTPEEGMKGDLTVVGSHLLDAWHFSTSYGGENGFNLYQLDPHNAPRLLDSLNAHTDYPRGFVEHDGYTYAAIERGGVLIMKIRP